MQGKPNPELQLDILARFLAGESQKDIATRYGLTRPCVAFHSRRAWARVRGVLTREGVK